VGLLVERPETHRQRRAGATRFRDLDSSNPNVAIFDAAVGRIVAIGAGAARITAIYAGASSSVDLIVKAPLYPPQIETIDPFLATPASGALYEIPVVIIRYLPTTDGKLNDVAYDPDFYTLNQLPLATLKKSIDEYDRQTKFMLETGSRFRQYVAAALVAPPVS
jgi:hypothetical protein